jgi:hypothetical protein
MGCGGVDSSNRNCSVLRIVVVVPCEEAAAAAAAAAVRLRTVNTKWIKVDRKSFRDIHVSDFFRSK